MRKHDENTEGLDQVDPKTSCFHLRFHWLSRLLHVTNLSAFHWRLQV